MTMLYETGKRIVIYTLIIFFSSSNLFSQKKVAGYYFQTQGLTVSNILFDNLTHINHAFIWPQKDGALLNDQAILYPELVTEVHKAGKKILISIGGWGLSDGFASVAADTVSRSRFVNNVVEFVTRNGYDGIDLDWEYPSNLSEGKYLTKLVQELRTALNQINSAYLITMAVPTGDYSGKYFDYSKLSVNVDWFNLMAYDFHGSWLKHSGHNAPLYSSVFDSDGSANDGVKYLNVTRGIPKQKVMLGVPFYGKEFNSAGLYKPDSGDVTDLSYSEVVNKITSGQWEYNWDAVSKVPYLLNKEHTKFITYDDTMSIRIKCEYVSANDLAGMMIWALGQDVVNYRQSLLETIKKSMGFSQASVSAVDKIIPSSYILYKNYPNPFNPSTVIKFSIPKESKVKLLIFNSLGQNVACLIDKAMRSGTYEVKFDASNLPSGVYFYQLLSDNYSSASKMVLTK